MHTHFFNVEVYILYSQKCLQDMKFCGLRFWQESTNIVSTKTFGTCHSREVSTMSLLRYFSQTSSLPTSGSVPSLTPETLHKAKKRVTSLSREPDEAGPGPKHTKNTFSSYSTEDSARARANKSIVAFHSPRVYCPSAEEEVFGRVTRSVLEQCGDSRGNKFPYIYI